MIYGGAGYKVLLMLHLVAVVVAFGPWFLNGFFPATALKRSPAEGRAINETNFRVSHASQYAMYAVFVFGFGTIGAKAKHSGLSAGKPWVGISIVIWVAIIGILHGLILPAQRDLKEETGDRAALTQRQSLGAALINVLVVVAIYLMVFEPGR